VSITGVVRLFRADPQGLVGDGGRMALGDHLRELRARVLRSVLVLLVGLIIALFFYHQLVDLITAPYFKAQEDLKGKVTTEPVISGASAPLMLNLKLSAVAAVVCTSPYWLYQIWAFIVPGLHAHEKRWTRVFVSIAGPLFIAGVAAGYYVLPKGLEVLISFTPDDRFVHLLDFQEYFSFFTRMLLIFGLSFELPLFVVLLNLAGILPARLLSEYRPWIVLGVFIFAAVATPSTDPLSMLMLAIPLTILFFISEVIARLTDRRRRRRDGEDQLGDDEATPSDLL
jgi:sec-independent protein translocase protein TatC